MESHLSSLPETVESHPQGEYNNTVSGEAGKEALKWKTKNSK